MTDWSKCPAVESVPGRLSGAWVFTGTRLPMSSLFENLESGVTVEEFLEWFDGAEEMRLQEVWMERRTTATARTVAILWDTVMSLALCALASLSAIAQWGQDHGTTDGSALVSTAARQWAFVAE